MRQKHPKSTLYSIFLRYTILLKGYYTQLRISGPSSASRLKTSLNKRLKPVQLALTLKGQSNEIFSSFEPGTDQSVKVSLSYQNFRCEKTNLPGYHTPEEIDSPGRNVNDHKCSSIIKLRYRNETKTFKPF